MALPASERIVIAETGDVFLTLRNPGAPFAVWEFDTEDDDAAGEINFEEEGNEQEGEEENANREGLRQKKRKMVVRLREGAEDQDMSGDGANPGPMTDDTIQPAHPSLVYQVSSQHLITASPKFKSELTSWSESVKGDDGFYHVNTTDWDPEAFAIMLNVLHLRIRKVSKSLSLELLAKVAMLVDYYRCWEAFDLIADVWIKDLRKKHPVPKTYGRKLMLWMLISWVFNLDSEFTRTTRIALLQSSEPNIRDMELGVPPAILHALESRRSETIEAIIARCHASVDRFSDAYTCPFYEEVSFNCSSMRLGALVKQMKALGIFSPQPTAPYDGFSIKVLGEKVALIRSPEWHHPTRRVGDGYVKHPCNLDFRVSQAVTEIVGGVIGLARGDFVDRGDVEAE